MVDDLRRGRLAHRHDVARAAPSARRACARSSARCRCGLRAELLIGLDVDAVRAVVEVEVVDVRRPQQDLHRVGDVAERMPRLLRLLAIDVDDELRIVGGELREQPGQARRLVALRRRAACAAAARSSIGPPLWSSTSNWNPPNRPMPWIDGGRNGITIAPVIWLNAPNSCAGSPPSRSAPRPAARRRPQPDEQDALVRRRCRRS